MKGPEIKDGEDFEKLQTRQTFWKDDKEVQGKENRSVPDARQRRKGKAL